MESFPDPFFVIGSPRSGTTFFVQVLQKHPDLFLTDEIRLMTFFNRAVHRVGTQRQALDRHQDLFLKTFKQKAPQMIRDFYVEALGAPPHARWGDKNPHYCDSKSDPECLELIEEFFPRCQYIHVVRDGREVVCSIVRKGWAPFKKAIDVWVRHVEHAREWGERLGDDRFLEVRHEDFYDRDLETFGGVFDFLGVKSENTAEQFLLAQRQQRTPFSGATSDVSTTEEKAWKTFFSKHHRTALEKELGPLLDELGYLRS